MHEIGAAKMTTAIKHICRGPYIPSLCAGVSRVNQCGDSGVHIPIDICKLTFGDSTSCYSFNSMHWGMASKVAVTAEKLRYVAETSACRSAYCLSYSVGGWEPPFDILQLLS